MAYNPTTTHYFSEQYSGIHLAISNKILNKLNQHSFWKSYKQSSKLTLYCVQHQYNKFCHTNQQQHHPKTEHWLYRENLQWQNHLMNTQYNIQGCVLFHKSFIGLGPSDIKH